jgi:PAS domain S-box-containing protein
VWVLKPLSPHPDTSDTGEIDALRLLVESTTDYAIFMLDPTGHVVSWNAGAERMNGYSAAEIIGQHFSVFYPPDALARDWPATELVIAAREGRLENEGWRVRKDGTQFWANVIITPLRSPDGVLLGFGKVSRDLTERRRSEQQLQESEERFRLIVESVIDYAIFMLDPQGHIVSWNAGAQRIKGYAADEIIGRHFSDFYPAEAVARGWPSYELQEAERVGRFEDEGWRVRKDGTMFWANVTITALRGPDGGLRGFAKVTRDMTERKANEDRIRLLTRELQGRVAELGAANRELAQKTTENESFVYSVSHDLRSPLVNLQGFSQELSLASDTLRQLLLEPDVPESVRARALSLLEGDFQESISFIRNAVQHLGNIIDGLLRLSRVGRIEYNSEPVDVNAVVADIVAAMHSTVAASGARIEIDHLPTAVGDRNAIGQIFANLIGNSINSLHPERPGLVRISATADDPPIFEVRDNGVGISPDYQAKLFQPFQHVHTGPTRGEGMGLAIVRRIVERHGGRIWFESVPDQGTVFFFTLAPGHTAAAAVSH